jgi:hypothetical protein
MTSAKGLGPTPALPRARGPELEQPSGLEKSETLPDVGSANVEAKGETVVAPGTHDASVGEAALKGYCGEAVDARPVGHGGPKAGAFNPLALRIQDATAEPPGPGDVGSLPTADEVLKTDYRDRLKTLIKLGERFPGVIEASPDKDDPLASLGVWAGLYMQTSWQKRSGRSESAWWNILNYSLSKQPEKYAAEYESGKLVPPTEKRADGKLTENDVRQAWYTFFKACDDAKTTPLRPGNLFKWLRASKDHPQKALWDAHCKSLHLFEQEYGSTLKAKADPDKEQRLEQSWISFVDYLGEANFPTTSKYAQPILDNTMPDAGILGKDADFSDLKGTKFIFARTMAALRDVITRLPGVHKAPG